MPDKIVTLNDILVVLVFCKSGENVWYLLFAQKKIKKIKQVAIKLNRKPLNFLGKQQQFKVVLHVLFLCLNPFSSLTHVRPQLQRYGVVFHS